MKSKEKDTIVDIESIPEELTDYDQWVNWKREIRDEKETKIPINPNTGKYASTSDSRTWGSFEEATEGLENYDVNGIGFVLTADDPFVGGDLDHCLDSETGELSEQAREVVRLVDTYTEKSPSGEGLRFIAKGKLPGSKTRKGNIELYQKSRYLTITGWHLANTPTEIHERQDQIDAMYYKHIDTSPSLPICKRPDSPPCELDNDEIMENARRLAGSKLDALRQGITSGYPSASEADLAFCGMIAQVTHGDVEKIDQIFRQSQLMRPKWDAKRSANGKTYGEMTIQKAITSSNNPFHIAEANIESMLVKVKKAPGTALRLILETPDYLRGLAFLAKNDQAKYELALAKLKELGLKARELTSLKSAVASEKKRLKQHKDSDSQEQGGTPVSDFLTNPPVPKTFLIPTGYRLSQDGIMRMGLPSPGRGSIDRLIAAAPVLIQGRLKDTHDQSEQLKMVWRRDKKWQTLTVPRGIIMNSRLITSLADQGFPVNSETARFVVEYLDLLEAINLQQIPVATISSRLGWQGEMGKRGFLCGRRYILADGKKIIKADLRTKAADKWGNNLILFKGKDSGDEQLADGFAKNGQFREWRKAAHLVGKFPIVMVCVYVSLAAPLLKPLNLLNFILDLANGTTSGKTTTLKFSASCWGNPDEKAVASVLKPWNSSQVWIERTLSTLNGLPLTLDETKLVRDPIFLAKVVYGASSGQGRGRGTLQGTETTLSWQTVLLSTGESKITELLNKGEGGAHARVLSLCGPPFGEKSEKIANLINQKVVPTISTNYGFAGPKFVKFILKNRDQWPKWKAKLNKVEMRYRKMAASNPIALRLASHVALIHLTGFLAKKALGLTWDYKGAIKEVWKKIVSEVREGADIANAALKHVVSLAASKQDHFWTTTSGDEKQPLNGWLGAWEEGADLAIFPHVLDDILKKQGYEPAAIIREWRDKRWLNTKGEKKALTKKVTVGKVRSRCYVIRQEVVKKFGGGTSEVSELFDDCKF